MKRKVEELPVFRKVSSVISQSLILHGVIQAESRRTYEYGFELLLSSVFGILILVLISLLSQRVYLWIPYMLGFVPLRLFGGGFHAKNHTGCILSFSIAFSILLFLSNYCANLPFFPQAAALAAFFVMIAYAPVETPNKPLKEEHRIKNRRISIAVCIANLVLAVLVAVFSVNGEKTVFMYFAGIFAASVSALVAAKINHTKRRSDINEAKG